MSRPLRIGLAGGLYQVTSRGDRGNLGTPYLIIFDIRLHFLKIVAWQAKFRNRRIMMLYLYSRKKSQKGKTGIGK